MHSPPLIMTSCSSAAHLQLQLKSAVAHLKLAHQCSLDAILAMVQEAYDETEEDREPEDDSDELEEEQSEEESLTLTSKLQRAYKAVRVRPRPNRKELYESLAFVSRVSALISPKDLVVDCCSGHGMIGMLFLAFRRAQRAVVIDKKARESTNVMLDAWRDFLPSSDDTFSVLEGDLREMLPTLLESEKDKGRICVVACHACAHLTDRVLETSCAYGVDVAVCPCCHRDGASDQDRGNIASAARQNDLPLSVAMDLVRMGRMQASHYDVRWRTVPKSITPMNNVLVCLAGARRGIDGDPSHKPRRDSPSGYRRERQQEVDD